MSDTNPVGGVRLRGSKEDLQKLATAAENVVALYGKKSALKPTLPKNSLSWIKAPKPIVRIVKK